MSQLLNQAHVLDAYNLIDHRHSRNSVFYSWKAGLILCSLMAMLCSACTSEDSSSRVHSQLENEEDTLNESSAGALNEEFSYFDEGYFLSPNTHANVVQTFSFIELNPDGTVSGFDLDGFTSEDGDEESCGHGDFVSPEGREGVDNQLAELWSTLAPLVGEQVHALLQNAINEGRVLVIFELEGVDDLYNDSEVTLNVFRGVSRPLVGTQGLLSTDQSFAFDYESPISSISGLEIKEGQLTAGPFELNIPITILSLDVIAKIEFGRVQLTINEEGEMTGFLTGAMNVPELNNALINTDAQNEARIVAPFFERNADMVKVDGVCTYLSMGLSFKATRAYVIRNEAKEELVQAQPSQSSP